MKKTSNKKKLNMIICHLDNHLKNKYKQTSIDINKLDIRTKIISNKDSYSKRGSFKYFIEYRSNENIRPYV